MKLKDQEVHDFELLRNKSKYSIDISKVLFNEQKQMTHKELCDALKIKPNQLSNIIKILEPFQIIFENRIGRNVYYSLNVKGCRFYDDYINNYAPNQLPKRTSRFRFALGSRQKNETPVVYAAKSVKK